MKTVNMLRKSLEKFKGDEIVTIEVINDFLFIIVNGTPVNAFNAFDKGDLK